MDERDETTGADHASGTDHVAGTDQARSLAADLVAAGPGLARLAAGIGIRVSAWAVQSGWTATTRLVRAAARGESVTSLVNEAVDLTREGAREILGVTPDSALGSFVGEPRRGRRPSAPDPAVLARRGRQLLARSADVDYEEPTHPAYLRILEELAPDEARILRLLAQEGPQPSVDVRTAGTPLAQVGSQMVAPGVTMIGAHAGLRYTDRVASYLNNLHRLGLVWFSREPVRDLLRYQVLEAQPEVAQALREAGRGRTVRRSIHLTPFGEDFCRQCFAAPTPPGTAPE